MIITCGQCVHGNCTCVWLPVSMVTVCVSMMACVHGNSTCGQHGNRLDASYLSSTFASDIIKCLLVE